jgi:membrane protease YdiL (CAAX protease family)
VSEPGAGIRDAGTGCDRRAVVWYLVIAFGGSWLIAGLFWLVTGGRLVGDLVSAAVGVPYMMVPMVAAIIVQKRIRRDPVVVPLGINFGLNRWWLVAWFAPLGIALAALGVSLLLPGVSFSREMAGLFARIGPLVGPEKVAEMRAAIGRLPVHPFWLLVGQGLVAGVTLNAVAGLGEELGWRGFLWREFERLGFWRGSWLIGIIWGVWHAPLVLLGLNYPSHPVAGIAMMTAWCVLLSPLFSFARLRTRSVVGAAVFHGSFNAFSGLALVMVSGGSDLLVGLPGIAGFVVLGMLNLLLALARPCR